MGEELNSLSLIDLRELAKQKGFTTMQQLKESNCYEVVPENKLEE